MRLGFRFRAVPFVATLVLVVLGILLGNWQTRRAGEKLAVAARMQERGDLPPVVIGGGGGMPLHERVGGAHPTDGSMPAMQKLEYRRVRLTGEWVADWPIFLDNRPHGGRAGFYLAMPFKIAGADTHVLVLRGWLPRDPRDYARLPVFDTPKGLVTLEGVVTAGAGQVMQLGTPSALEPGAIVQNVDVAAVARASGLALAPFFVQQGGAPGEGLVRDWPQPATGVDKHRGYAFQWYALAAMAALFFVITGFRSGRQHDA